MRASNLKRLNTINISKNASDYIVMFYLIRDLKSMISKYAFGKVLDVGCGNKPYKSLFNNSDENYLGCDVIQSSDNKVDILCKATAINAEDESFETVFSTQVMEHVDNSDLMMKECNRVLKPDGVLILSVPMCWELHEEPYDFFRFTKYGFKYVLEKAGFEMVEIKENGGTWSVTGQTIIHSFRYSKSKNLFIRLHRAVFFKLRIYWLVNAFFSWLDKKDYNPVNTMNYVVIARKPLNV